MVEKWDITFPAPAGDEARTVYVCLPESYQYNRRRRYPVLYMFDGHNVFFDEDATYGKSWGMNAYMERTKLPMIIAAVECNHSPDHGRLKEYSPFTFDDPQLGHIAGRGRTTMDWWVNVFKKEIDNRYRTLSDRAHTYIAGSSMGGLMSIYALVKYNRYFSKAAALSPSVWVAPEKLEHMINTAPMKPDTVLYIDYGELEFSNHEQMQEQFYQIINAFFKRHVLLNCRIIPGGTHCEASWEKQLPYFMNTLTYRP